jgi:hypothetical protein
MSKYSVKKAATATGLTTTGVTGFTIAGSYVAPIVLAYADRFAVPIPPELTVGVLTGLIAGFLAFCYDAVRYRIRQRGREQGE